MRERARVCCGKVAERERERGVLNHISFITVSSEHMQRETEGKETQTLKFSENTVQLKVLAHRV